MRISAYCMPALLVLTFGCQKAPETNASTTSQKAQETTASTTSQKASPAVKPAVATGPTKVTINFYGTVCHLLDVVPVRRSVFVRSGHAALMEVSTNDILKKDLEAAFGAGNVKCVQKDARCRVPLENTSIEFLSSGKLIGQPTTITKDDSFDELVPHLKDVTAGKMNAIHDDALKPPLNSNTLIAASVDLPPGEFSATAYNYTAEFDKDHQSLGQRSFGREIILTSTIDTPSLQVTIDGVKKTLPVQDSKGLELRVVNSPASGSTTHFDMHYDLSKAPLKPKDKNERPEIINITKLYPPPIALDSAMRELQAFSKQVPSIRFYLEVPGCSNSQWP